MNTMVYNIRKRIAIWLMISVLLGGCRPFQHTSAIWYTNSLPDNIVDGSQPAIGPESVDHQVSVCKQIGSGDLLYRVRFTNPYSETLTTFIGAALDGGARGTIWGIYKVELPPSLTEVTFNTSDLGKEERDKLFQDYLPSMITFYVNECSVHILGFEEGSDFQVTFPIAIKKLSSTFELPKALP